ncbi:MAG: hypothetical protein J6R52_03680 [Alphaproteobacteria bacterium]|nr:hypothetical protein [Alphaproteobacteria bacterium]
MNNADAIFWLDQIKQKYISGCDDDFEEKGKEAINLSIDCLRKSIPMKAKFIPETDPEGCGFYQVYCPNCNEYIGHIYPEFEGMQKYCSECGVGLVPPDGIVLDF